MNEVEALHTAGRRFCMERTQYWHARYAELAPHHRGSDYSDQEKDVFPRYNMLEAILLDVERLRPETFRSLDDAREWLVLAGQTAEDGFTKSPTETIEGKSMQEERDLFCAFVSRLDASALSQVQPLPYRHALTGEESKALWARVDARWDMGQGGSWYPLSGDPPHDTIALQAEEFHENVTATALQNILAVHKIERVFELREYGPEYEMDLCLMEPYYNGAEGYWMTNDLDWLVYASHESTVTVAGKWLVQAVQDQWPSWVDHQIRW